MFNWCIAFKAVQQNPEDSAIMGSKVYHYCLWGEHHSINNIFSRTKACTQLEAPEFNREIKPSNEVQKLIINRREEQIHVKTMYLSTEWEGRMGKYLASRSNEGQGKLGPCFITRSQTIISSQAQLNLVNKPLIIWPLKVENFKNCVNLDGKYLHIK